MIAESDSWYLLSPPEPSTDDTPPAAGGAVPIRRNGYDNLDRRHHGNGARQCLSGSSRRLAPVLVRRAAKVAK
jgi:hypothetical protein